MNALVALPLVASPTIVASASPLSSVDFELIALGRKIECAYAEIQPLRRKVTEMSRLVALEKASRPKPPNALASIQQEMQIWEDLGFAPSADRLDQLHQRADASVCRVMSLTPTAIIGLAVKARAAGFEEHQLWNEPFDDLDWDKKHFRSMVEAMCTMGGFPAPNQTMTPEAYEAVVSRGHAVHGRRNVAERAA